VRARCIGVVTADYARARARRRSRMVVSRPSLSRALSRSPGSIGFAPRGSALGKSHRRRVNDAAFSNRPSP